MLQTISSASARSSTRLDRPSYLSLQDHQSSSPFDGFSHLLSARRAPWQTRITRRLRSLSFGSPQFDNHTSGPSGWVPNLGVASTLTKIRNHLSAQRIDPHDNFYKLHDLNETDIPSSGSVGAQLSEHRNGKKHQAPLAQNSLTQDSMDVPSADPQDSVNTGSIGRTSSLTPSSPSSPDVTHSPTSGVSQTLGSIFDPKPHGEPSLLHSARLTGLSLPQDTNIDFETSRCSSPSGSEQSFTTRTSLPVAIVVLFAATGIASLTTELAVDAIPALVDSWNISHAFLGFIVLPFVGNAAEHVTAAKMALRNRMVLAKSVAVESATQVVLFITPSLVLFCWLRDRKLNLQFDHFEIGCILIAGVIVSIAICRGDSGWKQGVVLHAIYLIFALCTIVYRGPS